MLAAISALSSAVTVHSAIGGGKGISRMEAEPTPHVHLTRAGEGIRMELFVKPFGSDGPYLTPGVGRENVFAVINGKQVVARRDLAVERQKIQIFEDIFPEMTIIEETGAGFHIKDARSCLNALIDLKEMQDRNAVIVEWPNGEKIEVTRAIPLDRLQLAIRQKTDWFAVSGEVKLDDDLVVEMRTLLDWVGNSPGRFVPISEGKFLTLTRNFRERLEEIAACCKQNGDDIELHPGAALFLENLSGEVKELEADHTWHERVKRIQDGWGITPAIPSTLKAELRHYQEEGVHWLSRLAYWGFGACLADDMGLGKTIQALTIILDRAPEGPSLVVAPTSVCLNWIAELNRFAPTLNPIYFKGKNREAVVKALKPFDVLVVSYGLMQVESALLSDVTFETAVLDEAQAIKNYTTKRSQAAMNLKGKFKIITTGTPIENHLGELYALFQFINPGLLGSRTDFNERFIVPIEKDNDLEARQKLRKLIQPFILRRIKTEVLEELPPRTDIVLQVEMEEDEAALYEALRQRALERLEETDNLESRRFKILAEIMKLRRACCNPRLINPDAEMTGAKLTVFGNVVEELLENRHKALVFSQFVGHLEIIREYLDERGVHYKYLDGSTPAKQRKQQVDEFQAGEGDLFLISLKAGGLGLNLTAASYVIHMDPWWNPAVEDQASDRAHRIGQLHPVTVYRLVTHNTIEEKILSLHKKKRDLADSLLDGSDMTGKMTAKDLFKLIRER
ncbi:MAG: DEAD/DEAH box helicase [Desulfobacterales bacterium]|nr:DEAD/DEAH box helicase [Desulfobacterales bacterium]